MAAHFLKRHVNNNHFGGSAIVFWHEAVGCPPSVKALPLSVIEPVDPGHRVSEKTLCQARYRDQIYRCVVLWIEEDKTPDELTVARLAPASNEKIFEEKGYRWAKELQSKAERADALDLKSEVEDSGGAYAEHKSDARERSRDGESGSEIGDQRKYTNNRGSSEKDGLAFRSDPLDLNGGSPAYESSAASASGSTYGSRHHVNGNGNTSGAKLFPKQGRKQKLPTKACSMVPIVTPASRMGHDDSSPPGSPLMDDLDDEEMDNYKSSSTNAADSSSLVASADNLVQRMCLEATWTKALRCAMRELFTGDELATSLPHQSKTGMNVLDPHRLNIAKDLLVKYCTAKDTPQPSRRHVSQALHNCLISSRTSKFRMKKFSNLTKRSRYNPGKEVEDYRPYKPPSKYRGHPIMD